jgi:hypothetical protein
MQTSPPKRTIKIQNFATLGFQTASWRFANHPESQELPCRPGHIHLAQRTFIRLLENPTNDGVTTLALMESLLDIAASDVITKSPSFSSLNIESEYFCGSKSR